MITNREGHTGCHQVTPKTSKSTCNYTGLALHIKELIVNLAFWGWPPMGVTDWLIRRCHLGGAQ